MSKHDLPLARALLGGFVEEDSRGVTFAKTSQRTPTNGGSTGNSPACYGVELPLDRQLREHLAELV